MNPNQNLENELELQGDQRQPAMYEHGRLTITTEFALTTIKRIINTEGLSVAQRVHKQFCYVFSELKEWSSIAREVNELLEQESKRLSYLDNVPTFVNYGIYNEIQAGGNNIIKLGTNDGN